jgi:hypothetical protein
VKLTASSQYTAGKPNRASSSPEAAEHERGLPRAGAARYRDQSELRLIMIAMRAGQQRRYAAAPDQRVEQPDARRIAETVHASPAVDACATWADQHPAAVDRRR